MKQLIISSSGVRLLRLSGVCVQRSAGGHRAPTSVHEWQENILEGVQRETYSFFIFLFGCVVWSLWLIMNDCVFNNVVVSSPNVGISRVIFFHAEMGHSGEGRWASSDSRGELLKQLILYY